MRKYSHTLRVNGVFHLTEGMFKVLMSKSVFMATLMNKESSPEDPCTTSYSFHESMSYILLLWCSLFDSAWLILSALFAPRILTLVPRTVWYGSLHPTFKGCPQSIRDGQRNKEEETQNSAHTEAMHN
jgi:hypothetical protein